MSDEVEFIKSTTAPVCPFCEATLTQIEFQCRKLSTKPGSMWVTPVWPILFTCPDCHKVLGIYSWSPS